MGLELPRHLRDPKLEAAILEAERQRASQGVPPIEIHLKGCEITLTKDLDPVSGRWFVSLRMGRGDRVYILQLDSFNAERVGNALVSAAAIDGDEALKAATASDGASVEAGNNGANQDDG